MINDAPIEIKEPKFVRVFKIGGIETRWSEGQSGGDPVFHSLDNHLKLGFKEGDRVPWDTMLSIMDQVHKQPPNYDGTRQATEKSYMPPMYEHPSYI